MIEPYMVWIWLALFVLTLIIEAFTLDFVSIWFSVASLLTMFVSMFDGVEFWVEIIIFSVISVAAVLCTRPLIRKLTDRTNRKTNTDDFVGKRVKTVTDITKYDAGTVKLNGIEYTAILMEETDVTIPADTIVEVIALKGNKVVVKEIEE